VTGSHIPSAPSWETGDLEAVGACPACGSGRQEVLYAELRDQVFGIVDGKWSLQRCLACSSAYLDPRPAAHAIHRLYAGEYYTHATPLVGRQDGSGSRLGRRVRSVLDPRLRMARARQRRHLGSPRCGTRLLDVGCGSGQFVADALARGWDATGIDSDAVAITAGQRLGLPLSTESLEEIARAQPRSVDVMTMEHVIEHVPDPVGFLACAREVLAPSGTLWLATPNIEAAGHRRFKAAWKHLDPPRHLVVFSPTALDAALAAAGFARVRSLRSASGTIETYAHSWRINRGLSPLADVAVPPAVAIQSRLAGLRSVVSTATSDELIRIARRS